MYVGNIASATFVIGADAADGVRRQLERTATYLKSRDAETRKDSLLDISRRFENLLVATDDGFDTLIHPNATASLRAIWRPHLSTAGILYIVRNDELQTISLVLTGLNSKADVSAIEEVGRELSPLDSYFESLAVVRFGVRPIIATFCSRSGISRNVDLLQIAFAGAFFQHCGVPSSDPRTQNRQAGPSQSFAS